MKKSYSIFILIILLFFSESYAKTTTGFYVAGKMGISQQRLQKRSLSATEDMPSIGASAADSIDFNHIKKNVFHSGVGVGYNFEPDFNLPIRLEIDYINRLAGTQSSSHSGMDFVLLLPNYRDNELTYKSTIRTQTIMLNGYWDMMDIYSFRPYLFAGIGLSINKVDYRTDFRILDSVKGTIQPGHRTIDKLAWNIGFGVTKQLTEHWLVDLGYHFMSVGYLASDTEWLSYGPAGQVLQLTSNIKSKVQYQDLQLSVRYTF